VVALTRRRAPPHSCRFIPPPRKKKKKSPGLMRNNRNRLELVFFFFGFSPPSKSKNPDLRSPRPPRHAPMAHVGRPCMPMPSVTRGPAAVKSEPPRPRRRRGEWGGGSRARASPPHFSRGRPSQKVLQPARAAVACFRFPSFRRLGAFLGALSQGPLICGKEGGVGFVVMVSDEGAWLAPL
jgi:hypothetical protein